MYFTKPHSFLLNILQGETRIQQTADGMHFWILYCLKYYLSKLRKKSLLEAPRDQRDRCSDLLQKSDLGEIFDSSSI